MNYTLPRKERNIYSVYNYIYNIYSLYNEIKKNVAVTFFLMYFLILN